MLQRQLTYSLGGLLLDFVRLYGLDFNYCCIGISVRHDGFLFPKGASDRRSAFYKPSNPAMMAVENPLDLSHDVGSSSFRYQTIYVDPILRWK